MIRLKRPKLPCIVVGVVIAITAIIACPSRVAADQERYTSADELGVWQGTLEKLASDLDAMIEVEEANLQELRLIRENLMPLEGPRSLSQGISESSSERQQRQKNKRTMLNPVNAFVVLNRIRRALGNLEGLLEVQQIAMTYKQDSILGLQDRLPLEEDHEGAAQALLRLQAFYNLNTSKLADGHLGSKNLPSYRMEAHDCFEMGRLAYEAGQHATSIIWFYSAMERSLDDSESNLSQLPENTISNILDYMSFAAYKIGSVDYAAKLTQAWLERDPDNERALENLELYQEELAAKGSWSNGTLSYEEMESRLSEKFNEESQLSLGASEEHTGTYQLHTRVENYQVGDDAVVKRLCLAKHHHKRGSANLKCELSRSAMQNGQFFPGLRVEILNKDPEVLRVHDIISKKEAAYLRRLAKPNLQRSTIMSSSGLKASDFRIAKTAWLRADSDSVVDRVERRLGSLLDLGMEQSEYLQVVNYGLGGFYGPHMDSARATNKIRNESLLTNQLKKSDRLATVLLYLSRVDAGGATVFPRLNLTVRSIERSAVVWHNILENGYSDERTLHTGCPVLMGTKWIATKWPREEANSFSRPCKLTIDDKYK